MFQISTPTFFVTDPAEPMIVISCHTNPVSLYYCLFFRIFTIITFFLHFEKSCQHTGLDEHHRQFYSEKKEVRICDNCDPDCSYSVSTFRSGLFLLGFLLGLCLLVLRLLDRTGHIVNDKRSALASVSPCLVTDLKSLCFELRAACE